MLVVTGLQMAVSTGAEKVEEEEQLTCGLSLAI
jgi:hypothetical protein